MPSGTPHVIACHDGPDVLLVIRSTLSLSWSELGREAEQFYAHYLLDARWICACISDVRLAANHEICFAPSFARSRARRSASAPPPLGTPPGELEKATGNLIGNISTHGLEFRTGQAKHPRLKNSKNFTDSINHVKI